MNRPNPFAPQPSQPSNREKMKDAVQELMQNVAEEKAQTKAEIEAAKAKKERIRKRRIGYAVLLTIVLVISIVVMYPRWRQPYAPPTGAAAELNARRTLVFAADLVESFARRNGGRLPGSFAETGIPLPGIDYHPTPGGFALSSVVDGRTITFNRGDNPNSFVTPR